MLIATTLALLTLATNLSPGAVWSGFRGGGDSRAAARSVPVKWSETENVAWQVDLPGYGQSSPVVWGNRAFVTSIDGPMQDRLLVRCVDLATGKTLWDRELKGSQSVMTSDYVSKAAPTPVVDADRLYVFWESGDLAAFTHDGTPIWERSLVKEYGAVKSNHGLGSSPVLTKNGLVLLISQGEKPYLLSVDRKTGANRWKLDHPFGAGWTTPVAAEHEGRALLLVSSSGRVDAFDEATGEAVWFVDGLKGNTVPSPSVAGGLVVIGSSERSSTLAIRMGGKGNVTATHVVWRQPDVVCSFGSPLIHERLVYLTNRAGVAYCLDLETGKVNWDVRLPASSWAAPTVAEGRVYFLDTNGNSLVVKAGATLDKLAENRYPVTGKVYGLAIVNGALLFRTGNRLVRIGKPE
jgi:outer membrane protein assembly factor BamB